ncbi:hypothetical protein AAY473_009285, partial [Plecturocebus cupreus]
MPNSRYHSAAAGVPNPQAMARGYTAGGEQQHSGRPRWVNLLRSGVRDQPGQHGETLSLLKICKLAGRGAAGEAEAGELLKPGRWRLQRAEIMPLHSSLGNKSETPSQKSINQSINMLFIMKEEKPAATWKAEMGGALEPRSSRLQSAMISPVHSNLGDRMGFRHLDQTGLKCLISSDPPTSASQRTGIT